jgi:acetyl-CoA decarbonylase/synthase, CODH/ACS complex subunit delta
MVEIMLDQFHSVNVSGRTEILTSNRRLPHHLAKQLHILMANHGIPNDRILIDTTTGSEGYGIEY